VYHGSPHRINNVDAAHPAGRFDTSKIGTGEGAQAYGHGIYLAESPGVAKSYADSLGIQKNGPGTVRTYKGADAVPIKTTDWSTVDPDEVIRHAHAAYDLGGRSADERATMALRISRRLFPDAPLEWEDKIDELARAVKGDDLGQKKPGHFYTVDLPDEQIANMLDWDAPLSQQPEAVRKALASDPAFVAILGRYEQQAKAAGLSSEPKGDNIYAWLMSKEAGGTKEGASKRLLDRGVPGIRYMDGNSRGYTVDLTYKGRPYAKHEGHKFQTLEQAQDYANEQIAKGFGAKVGTEGTRNFVIFDGDTAKILKRE
jgi:hypothetical protein